MDANVGGHRSLLGNELRQIRELILTMGEAVDKAIARATRGLVERDADLCAAVVAEDAAVNALQAEARELSHTAILTQAPVARDLREIMGFLHMASEFERMGDHCVNIARIGRILADLPPLDANLEIPLMAQYCAEQVRDILGAVVAADVDQARAVAARDDRVDHIYRSILAAIVQLMSDDSEVVFRGTQLILVAHNLERIADRVTNLAEDLVFLETGEIEELG